LEGLATIRVVGEPVERPVEFADQQPMLSYLHEISRHAEFGGELYGLRMALEYGIDSPELASYLRLQETTHIQEGIELSQEDSTDFLFDGRNVRSPLNNETMIGIAEEGYEAQQRTLEQGKGFDFMVARTAHDIEIAADNDRRMKNSPVGTTWARFTPYCEEETDDIAAAAGFWPETKRAFMWLYRKKDDSTLETTVVTIDQSDVTAFAGVMHDYGTEVPSNVTSHDIPAYSVDIPGFIDSQQKTKALVKEIKQRYQSYAHILELPVVHIGSLEFLEDYAKEEIATLVRLQQEIFHSLEQNELSPYTKLATQKVLEHNYLSDQERRDIMKLYNTVNPQKHVRALKLVMRAHRYGAWESINQKIHNYKTGVQNKPRSEYGQQIMRPGYLDYQNYIVGHDVDQVDAGQLSRNSQSAQNAADQGKIKPGCPGGSSFLSQNEGEAKESIFGGKENDPKRWMSCPFCKKKEAVKARVCDSDLKCRHCAAEVKGGKIVNKGNGGKVEEVKNIDDSEIIPEQEDGVVIDLDDRRNEKLRLASIELVEYEQQKEAS
jgi:hypothetical protein